MYKIHENKLCVLLLINLCILYSLFIITFSTKKAYYKIFPKPIIICITYFIYAYKHKILAYNFSKKVKLIVQQKISTN